MWFSNLAEPNKVVVVAALIAFTGVVVAALISAGVLIYTSAHTAPTSTSPPPPPVSPTPSITPTPTPTPTSTTPPPTPSPSTGVSTAGEVAYLSEMDKVFTTGFDESGQASVNGVQFPRSLVMRTHHYLTTNTVAFNLSRRWKTLDATIGVRDDSASKSAVQFEVLGDKQTLYQHRFSLGQSKVLQLDVSKVLRLELVIRFIENGTDGGDYHAVWGDAHVSS
jgi:NPCBM/NEW2 domain